MNRMEEKAKKMSKSRRIFWYHNRPQIIAGAAAVGKTEGEGPLASAFDILNPDDGIGCKSWEAAEAALVKQAAEKAIEKSGVDPSEIGLSFSGDLLNQCTASTFGLRELSIPHAGLFGACSTFALALGLGAMAVDGGYAAHTLAVSSSHFCSAEKQFRFPLEYGGQRAQTTQRTVTGAGACILGQKKKKSGVFVAAGLIGIITDRGVTDASNMGAAMAPAAKKTIAAFLEESGTVPTDYDMILTGDLGSVGSALLRDLMQEEAGIDISSVHYDCGTLIFDPSVQDVHAGGSGCGCSAAVVSSRILRALQKEELKRVLFVGTGALMSPVSTLQGEIIPCVAHAVLLCAASEGGEVLCGNTQN